MTRRLGACLDCRLAECDSWPTALAITMRMTGNEPPTWLHRLAPPAGHAGGQIVELEAFWRVWGTMR